MIKQHKKYNALGIWHNLVTQSKYYKKIFFFFFSDMNPSINLQWWKYNLQNHSPMLFLSYCSAMSSRGPWWLFLVSTSYPHCSQLEGKRKRWWYDRSLSDSVTSFHIRPSGYSSISVANPSLRREVSHHLERVNYLNHITLIG